MEIRDYYNINKQPTGETYTIDVEPTGDNYMLIVVCFMQNSEGKFLIQKASKEKGNKWGTTGGHPKAGEDSLQGMKTEIREELGLDVENEKFQFINTFIGKNKIVDLYYIFEDIDISMLKLQKEEVDSVRWMTTREIEQLILEKKFEKTHSRLFKDIKCWLSEKNESS